MKASRKVEAVNLLASSNLTFDHSTWLPHLKGLVSPFFNSRGLECKTTEKSWAADLFC